MSRTPEAPPVAVIQESIGALRDQLADLQACLGALEAPDDIAAGDLVYLLDQNGFAQPLSSAAERAQGDRAVALSDLIGQVHVGDLRAP